jgi:hypothetical protein
MLVRHQIGGGMPDARSEDRLCGHRLGNSTFGGSTSQKRTDVRDVQERAEGCLAAWCCLGGSLEGDSGQRSGLTGGMLRPCARHNGSLDVYVSKDL